MSSETSDLSDDIVQSQEPEHSKTTRRRFMPWHKVRKQFIRERQWNERVIRLVRSGFSSAMEGDWSEWTDDAELIETQGLEGGDPSSGPLLLSCLTLPGDDLLDIRSLWHQLQSRNCWIKYLGFNSGHGSGMADSRVSTVNHEVTRLDRVALNSEVLHDKFQMLANTNSVAYRRMRESGPFHVINLDICDTLFPTVGGSVGDYFKAIDNLIAYQMQYQKHPWLLFITTLVDTQLMDKDAFNALCKPTRDNCQQHQRFADALHPCVPSTVLGDEVTGINLEGSSPDQLVRLFGIALGKKLLNFLNSTPAKWEMRMRTSYSYIIEPTNKVPMLSLAYEVRPHFVPPVDSTGLGAGAPPSRPEFSEVECALSIVERVQDMRDVDEILAEKPEVRAEMLEKSASLLATAQYDRNEYHAWVRNGEMTN